MSRYIASLIGFLVAGVLVALIGPLYGAPALNDAPIFYLSACGTGLALVWVWRWAVTDRRK